jgi:hypothetical protein
MRSLDEPALAVAEEERDKVAIVVGEYHVQFAITVEIGEHHFGGWPGLSDRAPGTDAEPPIPLAQKHRNTSIVYYHQVELAIAIDIAEGEVPRPARRSDRRARRRREQRPLGLLRGARRP